MKILIIPLLLTSTCVFAHRENCNDYSDGRATVYYNCLKELSNWSYYEYKLNRRKGDNLASIERNKKMLGDKKDLALKTVQKQKLIYKFEQNNDVQGFYHTLDDLNKKMQSLQLVVRRNIIQKVKAFNAKKKEKLQKLLVDFQRGAITNDKFQKELYDMENEVISTYNSIYKSHEFLKSHLLEQGEEIFQLLKLGSSRKTILELFDSLDMFITKHKDTLLNEIKLARDNDVPKKLDTFTKKTLEKLTYFESLLEMKNKDYKELYKIRLYLMEVDKLCETEKLPVCTYKPSWTKSLRRSTQVISNLNTQEINKLLENKTPLRKVQLKKLYAKGERDAFFLSL